MEEEEALQIVQCFPLVSRWAAIPLMYMTVGAFKDTSSGYMTMFLINLIVGVTTTACVFLLSLFTYIEVGTI